MRRPVLLGALVLPLAVLATPGALAAPGDTSTTVDAPPSSSSGVAAQVGGVTSIGRSAARTDSTTARAEGGAVEVQGKPLVEGRTGGSSTGSGRASGSLADTGSTTPVRAELTPWSAETSTTPTKRSATGSAALARVTADPVPLRATVLGSTSSAEHTGARSSSAAESDALDLTVGDQRVRVLHSETTSTGQASTYLLGINGAVVLGNEQVQGACALVLPPVLALSCLQADGGDGSAAATARALLAEPAVAGLPNALVSGASSSGGTAVLAGPVPAPVPGGAAGAPTSPGSPGTAAPGRAAPSDDPALPFTGVESAALVGLGAWLAAAGAYLRVVGRRRAVLG